MSKGKLLASILKPLQKNVKFRKKYDVDLGKESAAEKSVRDVRADKGRGGARAADAGSDPIVIGKKSMASFAEGLGNAPLSRIKNKLEKLADEIPAAKTALKKIEKLDEQKEVSRVRKSAVGRAGTKKLQAGEYVHKQTGEVITVTGKEISPKKLPGKRDDYIRNPTANQLEQIARSMFTKRRLKATGDDKESTIKRLQLMLVKKIDREKGTDKAVVRNRGGAITKSNKGPQDFRNGGMVLSTVDRRKKRG
jgi:hypothetical protein